MEFPDRACTAFRRQVGVKGWKLYGMLYGALAGLSDREREIIELRYGMRGRRELTQKEVADRLGISQSYISRLEKKIISKLKADIEARL